MSDKRLSPQASELSALAEDDALQAAYLLAEVQRVSDTGSGLGSVRRRRQLNIALRFARQAQLRLELSRMSLDHTIELLESESAIDAFVHHDRRRDSRAA